MLEVCLAWGGVSTQAYVRISDGVGDSPCAAPRAYIIVYPAGAGETGRWPVRVVHVFGVSLMLAFLWLSLAPVGAHAAIKQVEEFDGYADDAALQAAWVVSNAKDQVVLKTPGYQTSTKSMKLEYHNNADPYYTAVTMTYGTVQDWSDFRKLACRFMGFYPDDPPEGNSGERFFVRIYDEWGGWRDGPKVDNATKTYEWVYYSMDIDDWANRGHVAAVSLILEPQDYGQGQLYVDRIHLDTSPPILDDYETYVDTDELRDSWLYGANNLDYLLLSPGPDGAAGSGDQYCALDYLCSAPPYQADLVLEFDYQEDWRGFTGLTLLYRGRPDPFNSSEGLQVILEDAYGGTFSGPYVGGATQCPEDVPTWPYCDWNEYQMDFSSWASKAFVKKVIVRIVPESYGDGRLYVDYILLGGTGVPAEKISWGGIKAKFR
jgi:hypothetical protein